MNQEYLYRHASGKEIANYDNLKDDGKQKVRNKAECSTDSPARTQYDTPDS